MKAMSLLFCCKIALVLALHDGASSSRPEHVLGQEKKEFAEEEPCPPCEQLFRKLRTQSTGGEHDGKLSQVVKMTQRGEPKSGTGYMYDLAAGAIARTCEYLQLLFGAGSCRLEFVGGDKSAGAYGRDTRNGTMIFEPALGGQDAKCSCETVARVSITLSNNLKHFLPVDRKCPYWSRGMTHFETSNAGITTDGNVYKFTDGTQVQNKSDLWQWMSQANCDATDDWLQMVAYRDPRALAVSLYFFEKARGTNVGALEEFVAIVLPQACQHVTIRYMLFSGFLKDQSEQFWYEDAMSDPMEWHYRWFDFAGLQLPAYVVDPTASFATDSTVDNHPGQEIHVTTAGGRRFEDQVSQETIETAKATLLRWLPSELLARLGVGHDLR